MSKYQKAIDYLQPIADNAELSGYSEALGVAMDALREIEKLSVGRENADKVQCAAMETFGEEKQIIKLSQEIGEFLMAFTQYMEGRDKLSHVAEEMADVHNMLDQWALHLGCVDEVERQKRYKLKRLEQRIEEYKGKENKPLTLDELRQMDGDKIYIQYIGPCEGFFKDEYAPYYGQNEQYVQKSNGTLQACGLPLKHYGKTWTAYRHKPQEVQP